MNLHVDAAVLYSCTIIGRFPSCHDGTLWICVMSYSSSVTCSFCLTKLTKFEPMLALSEIIVGSSAVVDVELQVPGFGLVVAVVA